MKEKGLGTPTQDTREFAESRPVDFDGCGFNLQMGEKVDPNEKLSKNTLVLDTGVYSEFLDQFKKKQHYQNQR